MTNILQDGVTWIGARLKAHAGVTISYSRGIGSVSITATAAMHQYEVVDQDGLPTQFLSRDYLVQAADLVIDATTIAPRIGDRISETIGSVVNVFEVMPIPGKKECEPEDPDGVLLRIHTKKVG